MDFLKKALLGWASDSAAKKLDTNAAWASIRVALVTALIMGGIAAVESFNGHDWGVAEGIVSTALIAVVELLRRWLKDYTKDQNSNG